MTCASVVLPKPGRAGEQDVVERLVAPARRLDQDAEILLDARLAQVLVEPLRPQAAVDLEVVFGERGRDEPLGLVTRSRARAPASQTVLTRHLRAAEARA